MKQVALTILLLTLTAALALGAGNNWRNERPITGAAGNYGAFHSAIAASGNKAVVVYDRWNGFTPEYVHYKTTTNGGVIWSAENTLPNAVPLGGWRPVAVMLNGNVIEAAVGVIRNGHRGLWYYKSTDFGNTWAVQEQIQQFGNDQQDIAATASITRCTGSFTQVGWVYFHSTGGSQDESYINYRRRNNGTNQWEPPLSQPPLTLATYSYSPGYSTKADIGGNSDTDIPNLNATFVVWADMYDGDIYYKKSTNQGNTWGGTTCLHNNTGFSNSPAVKVNGSRQGYVLWENNSQILSKLITGANYAVVEDRTNFYPRNPRFTISSSNGYDSLYAGYEMYEADNKWKVYYAKSADWNNWLGKILIQNEPSSWTVNERWPDVASTITDGAMRLYVWNGYIPSLTHQELWLGVNDLGSPAAPTNLQTVKFCSLPPAFVQVTYTATTALDDSGYNNYKHEPKCGPPWTKLNSDIVTGTVYYDFTIPQSYPECDAYCACYMARAIDLALNEGGDSNTSEVGFCDAPSLPPATLVVAASLGQPAPSAYTQRRGGYLNWGSGKSADVDPDQLEYRIRGLDTSAYYVLDFGYYAPDSGSVVAARAGDALLHGPKAITQDEACIPVLLSKTTYASGTLSFTVERVEGPNAILGKFRLWKMPEGYRGGPQSAGLASRNMVQPFLAPPRPNPSTGEVYLGYWLPKESEATLRIFNTAGQLVREVDTGAKAAGTHNLTWDGKNASGRRVPNGVYLARLQAGSISATQKITILR